MSEKRYHLTVKVSEINPNYKPWEPPGYNHYDQSDPRKPEEREPQRETRALDVVLTEVEYLAVKRAVLEIFT